MTSVWKECGHEVSGAEFACLYCRIAELEAHIIATDKHQTAEEPGELCFNEVTGLHAEADLYRIAELEAALKPFAHPDLRKPTVGMVQGGNSPVFGKNNTLLLQKHFQAAYKALQEQEDE